MLLSRSSFSSRATRGRFVPPPAPPVVSEGSLAFYRQLQFSDADDYAQITSIPTGFGEGEFTFEMWIRLDNAFPVGAAGGTSLTNWSNADPAVNSSSTWWYAGNFIVDGHNNNDVRNGTFSFQAIGGGRLRWSVGDGTVALANGGLLAVQPVPASSAPSLIDGRWHKVAAVRRNNAGNTYRYELWIDGELNGFSVSTSRVNLRQWFDSWSGFPSAEQGLFIGAEKRSATRPGSGAVYWDDHKGGVARMAFFSRAKTTAELQNDWWVTPQVGDSGLVGLFLMGALDGNNRTYDSVRPAEFISCFPRSQGAIRLATPPDTDSALGDAAAALASNTFLTRSGNGLNAQSVNPVTGFTGYLLSDARLSDGQSHITGFAGKGCYDSRSRRVLFMGCGYSTGGQNNAAAGAYAFNTRPQFIESTDTWTVERGFRAADETTAAEAIGHLYDGNAIDVIGRRQYKLKKDSPQIYVYDLDSRAMLNSIAWPAGISSSTTWGSLEFIPSRGAQGSIWMLQYASGSNAIQLWEYNVATATWSVIITAATLGNSTGGNGPTMSYNPRAFGGAGGVMMGNQSSAWTVRADTLAVASIALPNNRPIDCASADGSSGFCRDPVGTGWLKFSDTDNVVYRFNGSSWETRAALPAGITGDYVVIPIDAYGVVMAVVWGIGGTSSAFIYRP